MTAASRPALGYLLRAYPRFSQTFVVNEILELERQGVGLCIASLKRPRDGRFHESISRVEAQVDYLPDHALESVQKTIGAHWHVLRRAPGAYARAWASTCRHRGAEFNDLRQAALLLRWARKRRLDHVHVHFGTQEATVAYLAHRMGGLGYSLTLHAFDIFRDTVDRRLLARKINASRFTVTVSRFNREALIARCPGVDEQRIHVNYNGIDLQRFKPPATPRQPGTILGIGRLIEKKGFIHLIEAVGQLRQAGIACRCTIVGDGPETSALQAAIRRWDLRKHVQLTGGLTQDRVRELLASSWCMALPCVEAADGNVDALPTVLLEAMACGCPCVSTRLSGIPEIIDHGICGLLAEPGDVPGLTAALRSLLTDPNRHAALALAGRHRAETRFDVVHAVGCLRTRFSEALGGHGTPDVQPALAPVEVSA